MLLLVGPVKGARHNPTATGRTCQPKKYRRRTRKASRMYRNEDRTGALEEFKKADKQDGGQCLACQQRMINGMALGDWVRDAGLRLALE